MKQVGYFIAKIKFYKMSNDRLSFMKYILQNQLYTSESLNSMYKTLIFESKLEVKATLMEVTEECTMSGQ